MEFRIAHGAIAVLFTSSRRGSGFQRAGIWQNLYLRRTWPTATSILRLAVNLNNVQLETIYPRYRMYAARGYKTDWTGAELVRMLKQAGPMIAYGRFQTDAAAATDSGLQHAIVVYGVHRGEMVRYNDPWQPKEIELHYGHFSLAAYTANMAATMTAVRR